MIKVHKNLQMNPFLHMKVHMKVQKRLQVRVHEGWAPSSCKVEEPRGQILLKCKESLIIRIYRKEYAFFRILKFPECSLARNSFTAWLAPIQEPSMTTSPSWSSTSSASTVCQTCLAAPPPWLWCYPALSPATPVCCVGRDPGLRIR